MGRGNSSTLQVQAPAVAAIKINYGDSVSTSEQMNVCEYKEATMRRKCTTTTKTGVNHISITANFKLKLVNIISAALLVFGYGDGFSTSTLAYSIL